MSTIGEKYLMCFKCRLQLFRRNVRYVSRVNGGGRNILQQLKAVGEFQKIATIRANAHKGT